MATLREQIESDLAAVFLQVDEFAEELTFLPKGDDARIVYGVADEDTVYEEEAEGLVAKRRLVVTVSRDRDADPTGVDVVELGDGIRRAGAPEHEVFAFTGEVADADDSAWTLTFIRALPYEVGGSRRR